MKNNGITAQPKAMTLDNLIIRDATEEEKQELASISASLIEKMVDEEASEMTGNRCSIIQMTPRDSILNTDREDL